jgi:hypothetical protein
MIVIAGGQEIAAAARKLGRGILRVGNVYDPSIKDRDAMHVFARERDRKPSLHGVGASRIAVGNGRELYTVPIRERDHDRRVGKELEPTLHDRVEHRLGIVK